MPPAQILFNNNVFLTPYVFQQGRLNLKISSYLSNAYGRKEVKSVKNTLTLAINDCTDILDPGKSLKLSINSKKSIYQVSLPQMSAFWKKCFPRFAV